MNVAPLNHNKSSHVTSSGYPSDWQDDIRFYGLSRNESLRCYVVRLAVGGRQLFLGNAYNQEVGARLYDLALWKMSPKMSRAGNINFPDNFGSISQEIIDRDAPRLNTLYAQAPFLKLEDEKIPEDQLRAQRLERGFAAKHEAGPRDSYVVAMGRLKRIRAQTVRDFATIGDTRSKLLLNKLPDITTKFLAVETSLAQLSDCLRTLEESMESQHAYYRKLKSENESV